MLTDTLPLSRGKPPAEQMARDSAGRESYGLLYWWLLVVLFFEYARPASYLPVLGVLPLNSLLPVALFVFCLFGKGLRPFGEIYSSSMAKWMTVYITLIALSIATADVTFTAYSVFRLSVGYYLLFVMVVRIVRSERQLLGVMLMLAAAHVFLIAMNPAIVSNPAVRSYVVGATFLGDGNDFGLSICIVIPFVLEVGLRARTAWRRLLAWVLVTLLLLAIVGTSSRGATLGAIAVFGYLWVYASKKIAGLVAVAIVGIAVVAYAPDSYFERMGTIANYQSEGSAQGRIIAWKAGTRMALDNPMTGVSAGHFPMAFGTKYMPAGLHIPWLTAHSIYFLILGELGFPGVIVLIVLIVGNITANARLRRQLLVSKGPMPKPDIVATCRLLTMGAAAVIGFAVAGAFLSAAYYPHIYVICGLLVAHRAIVVQSAEGMPNLGDGGGLRRQALRRSARM